MFRFLRGEAIAFAGDDVLRVNNIDSDLDGAFLGAVSIAWARTERRCGSRPFLKQQRRAQEVVGLDLADYSAETAELRVRRGKGQKDRVAYLTKGAVAALDEWLTVRSTGPGPLSWPADGRGRAPVNRRMADQSVFVILRKRGQQARLKPFTPHDLRRSFVGDLLDAGADMSVVQQLAGHADIRTTASYDRRGEEAKQRAAELLHVPF